MYYVMHYVDMLGDTIDHGGEDTADRPKLTGQRNLMSGIRPHGKKVTV